jgi:hypothetical protein
VIRKEFHEIIIAFVFPLAYENKNGINTSQKNILYCHHNDLDGRFTISKADRYQPVRSGLRKEILYRIEMVFENRTGAQEPQVAKLHNQHLIRCIMKESQNR